MAEENVVVRTGTDAALPSAPHDGSRARRGTGRGQRAIAVPTLRRETRLMVHALLDDHWPVVRRLVRVLCAHRMPVTLPATW